MTLYSRSQRPSDQQGARLALIRIAIAAYAAVLGASALASGHASAPQLSIARQLSIDEIVEKNAAARGGLDAWRHVRTMLWLGRIQSAHAPMPSMQFSLQQQRPNKTRFEINAMGEKTVRIFDGTYGWKGNASHSGRSQVRPFTIEEIRYAQNAQGIDGPLIDHAAKGIQVTLEGLDEIEGRKAYRLALQAPSGETDRLWIDATSFLDVRYDRTPDAAGGASRVVSTRYRDYKTFDGLQIPSIIETGASAAPGSAPDRMIIETAMINPPLDKRTFTNPAASRSRSDSPYAAWPQAAGGGAADLRSAVR